MIELKNIGKIYKSKKGVNTIALKDISIKLPEKGMVFILGKSGSGKSTLLNVLGGLDKYDSGDLIIDGKSTKNFKAKDFDAYRNTYIGFIFQDFNLLDKYNVYNNVKLAMDLQNKKASKIEISNVLKLVELDGLEKRKINELSGGQKQRIAIARALIKNPSVILADEPTGNLDSYTGKQIFELLKKLSKEKLVVVVSHDDESAEKYADRIIRIRDGEIIEDTDSSAIEENKRTFNLIKARLPFRYSFKMAIGNLLHKKIKLLFTVLLVSASLICFGLAKSATSFDSKEESIKLMVKNNDYKLYLSKYNQTVDYETWYLEYIKSMISGDYAKTDELEKQVETIGFDDDNFVKEVTNRTGIKSINNYQLTVKGENLNFLYGSSSAEEMLYYLRSGSVRYNKLNDLKIDNNILIGKVPENSNEILITSFIADQIIEKGVYKYTDSKEKKEEIYKPLTYTQIVNDKQSVKLTGNVEVKIAGILNYDVSKYNIFKNISTTDYMYSSDYDKIVNEFSEDINLLKIYVLDSFFDYAKEKVGENTYTSGTYRFIYNDNYNAYYKIAYFAKNTDVYTGEKIVQMDSLTNNEIVIDLNVLNSITNRDYSEKLEKYIENNYDYNVNEWTKKYIKDNNIIGTTLKSSIVDGKIVQNKEIYNEYKIVGVILEDSETNTIYYSKDTIKRLIIPFKLVDTISIEVSNEDELRKTLEAYPVNNGDILANNTYINQIIGGTVYTKLIKTVGKYASMFFLVFSTILLMSFILNSISYRKKEIGILRAIGCKSKDIFLIFMTESLCLAGICLIISYNLISFIAMQFNNAMGTFVSGEISFINFDNLQFIYLLLATSIITILANLIPIKRITKMKPIDVILNK